MTAIRKDVAETKKRKKRNRKPQKRKVGRPTTFKEEYYRQAKALALMGWSNTKIAEFFGIAETCLYKWINKYPKLGSALHEARWVATSKVARSLYHRARGYSHRAIKIFADPKTGAVERVPYVERYPPDVAAAKFWLTNRAPEAWRDKVTQEVVGANDGPIQVESITPDYRDMRVVAKLPST